MFSPILAAWSIAIKYMNKGYYHVYSFGEDTPKLLISDKEFVMAINLLAYCSQLLACSIIAFVFMNSHFHLVLYGTEDECRQFGMQLMKLILHRINRIRERPYEIRKVAVSADLLESKEDVMSVIAYVHRNPIEAGFKFDPRFYKWSSASLFFAPESFGIGVVGKLSRRSRVATLGMHYEVPGLWTYSEDGAILAKHYVAWQDAMKIFGGIKAYIAFMYMKKDRILDLNKSCARANFEALSDDELRMVARRMARKEEDVTIANMDLAGRIALAQKLKSSRGAGIKQLARVLDVKIGLLESVLA